MSQFENHPLHPGNGTPLFIAAGVLKDLSDLQPFMTITDPLTAPLLVLGTHVEPIWAGNAKPGETNFVYYPGGTAGNAIGLKSGGVEAIRGLKTSIHILGGLGVKTAVSVSNLPHEAAAAVIPKLAYEAALTGATAVEANLGCPNGKKEDGSLHPPTCNNVDASEEVIDATRRMIGGDICFGIKDGPHVTSLEAPMDTATIAGLAEATKHKIDYICGINTIGNQPFPEISCTGGRGGMSGPIVAPIARKHLQLWQEFAPEVPYLSCGGVDKHNAGSEINDRLAMGALLVGGAQEFYRAADPYRLSLAWTAAYINQRN